MPIDPLLASYAASVFANFTTAAIQKFFSAVFSRAPDLKVRLAAAHTLQEVESIFKDAVGVIDAAAGQGNIDIDSAFLEALRGIRFDHNSGTVTIQGAVLSAPVLQTGGTGPGTTHIGAGTLLKTKGTSISVGKGCSIKMSGNARITQT